MDSLIKKATSNDEKPTPGWMYNELASKCACLRCSDYADVSHNFATATTHGDITSCEKMKNALNKKLKSKHATVKYKALLVIKVYRDLPPLHFATFHRFIAALFFPSLARLQIWAH